MNRIHRLLVRSSACAAALALGMAGAFAAAPKYAPDTPLQTQPDWKAEAILVHPDIHHPSVVCCAPDGRVFVAEDPADMPGPSNGTVDRILCLFPDGHKTVFAENLHAVFGIQYVDGKVYVHHTPFFSVFTDDNGVGKDRKDIINTTNPNPNNNGGGFNDHIPSNFRLAMDGYFYMSTGDKGIYECESNVDHKRAEIRGGGVLRIRPDGTDMEVYSTGTRNHLDISINPEDEIFTYDNTDDGQGWWTRFTHMVDGGYYGYPYDYKNTGHPDDKTRDHSKPYQPYTLWRIEEYAGGSPCGATGYNEDALPPEYRGNLFHCEWGKGEVERFVVERDGGTYKVVSREPKFLAPGGTLRPVGITTMPDGMGFYVCDWNFGGWRNKQDAGRLIKLTYTGKSQAAPKPVWFIPAAEGQTFQATTADLVAGLSHPAQSVRLVAQRRVAERGAEAIAPLAALLDDAKAPAYARWSAIWTLDHIEGGKAGRESVIKVAADSKADASVRRQAIRQLGTRRAVEGTDAIITALGDPDASIRFRAATALGRIGNAKAVPALLAKLDEPDFFTRYAVFTALKRIGQADPKAWPAIVPGFESDKAATREGTALAVRDVYDPVLVNALAGVVKSKSPAPARGAALLALAELHREVKPWDGKWWGTQPGGSARPPKDADWEGTPLVLATIRDALKDADPALHPVAIRAMQVAPDPAAADALVQMFNADKDVEVRRAILGALGASKSPAAGPLVSGVLRDPASPPALVVDAIAAAGAVGGKAATDALVAVVESNSYPAALEPALAALGGLKDAPATPAIAKHLSDGDVKVSVAAANALAQVGGKPATEALIGALSDPRGPVRRAAASGLGALRAKQAVPALVQASKDKETSSDAILALTRMPTVEALDAYLDGIAGKDASLRKPCKEALTSIQAKALPLLEAKMAQGGIPPNTLAAVQAVYGNFQPITDWQIVGPFSNNDIPFTPDNVDLKGEWKGVGGKPIKWEKVHAPRETGLIDPGNMFGTNDNVAVFALTEFDSPDEREVEFLGGADDTLTVWLNGQKMFDSQTNHSWRPDEFEMKGKAKAGRNVVLLKCGNKGGTWQFSLARAGQRQGKLFETVAPKKPSRDEYAQFAMTHMGHAEWGARLFHNAETVGCIKCHTVGNEGGQVGPNLAGVGVKYDRAKLIESVVKPSAQILDGYQQTFIKTKDGEVQAGVVHGETETEVTLYDSAAKKYVIKKSDIATRKISDISVMPEGLEQAMTLQEFADLVTYLESLRDKPPEPKK